ncbi:MAG: hypothetical protein HUJ80_05555 [Firmicutes bacterium]|nr:hypothetical protein [Bacillota bacterium]
MPSNMKRIAALLLTVVMLFSLASCGGKKEKESTSGKVVLDLFASTNSVLAVANLVDRYQRVSPNTSIRVTYDEPSMLAAKIEAGYDCDIFICEDSTCMDWLDGTKSGEANPNKNNCLESDTRKVIFKGLPEGAVEFDEYQFEVAMTKNAASSDEISKFIDFISSKSSDSCYEGSGFSRVEE